MEITAAQVKELRDKTGAGIMDAKRALVENDGDMDKSMEYLRQKGIASADKKMSRIAAEGVVSSCIKGKVGAMLEMNCETDFVAKNEDFLKLIDTVCEVVADKNPATIDELNAAATADGTIVEELVKTNIVKIGEKITVRRFVRYEGSIATYVHNKKIGVLLNYEGSDEVIAKDICLHIASSAPEFISRDEISKSVIDEETRIEMGKEDLANKPENIRAKIVEGRVNKLLSEKCLLEQPFVKNPDITIADLVKDKIKLLKFDRFVLGEGLEKRQENFADEVMKQMN